MTATLGPSRLRQSTPVAVVTSDGTPWSWPDLFEEFAPAIRSYARSKGVSSPDDIVQEVFTTVAGRFPDFEGDQTGLRSLFFTLAYRRIADEYRTAYRNREDLVADHQPIADASPSIEDHVTDEETAAEAMAALEILNDRERNVIEMRIIDEATPAQVARVLGISNGNVRVIQARALLKIRKYLTAGRTKPLPSIGLLVAFVRALRKELHGGVELQRWMDSLQVAGERSTDVAISAVGAATTTGLAVAGTLKVGLAVSLATATVLGSLAVHTSYDEPAPAPEPAVSTAPETGLLPSPSPAQPGGGIVGFTPAPVVSESPQPEVVAPPDVDAGPVETAPSEPAESADPTETPPAPSSEAPPHASQPAEPSGEAPTESPDGGGIIEPVLEETVTVVEETVNTVVEDVVEPLVDDVVTGVTETTNAVVDDVVEPVVTEVVEPVVEDVTEVVDDAVEDVTDLTETVVNPLSGLLGG